MTTIYVPRPIESAEQAEALPIGTVAVLWDGPHVIQHATLTSARRGPWDMDMHGYEHHLFVGWTALVPIEAEEEWAVRYDEPDEGAVVEPHINEEHARAWAYSVDGAARSRLVTRWEEA